MILDLETVKSYLRIDFDYDDPILQSLMVASEGYLKSAITDFENKLKNNDFLERARIVALSLVQEWYDNRENNEKKSLSYTIRSLITQLEVQ